MQQRDLRCLACRAPSQETAATGHVLLAAALQALTETPGAAAAHAQLLLSTLQQQLHSMNAGDLGFHAFACFLHPNETPRD